MISPPALSPALAASRGALFDSDGCNGRAREGPLYDSAAVWLLAASAARRGQLTKAGRLLWDLLVSSPGDQDVRLALVSVMIQRDWPAEALALLDEALTQDPRDARIAERKAFILAQLGQLEDAFRDYTKLVTAEPDRPSLLVARGQLSIAMGHEQAAVEDYRRAIGVRPGYGEAWWALANIKTVRLSDGDRRTMEQHLLQQDLGSESRIGLEFALGKLLEDEGSHERSFGHYRRGNELRSEGAFDPSPALRAHVDQVIASFRPGGLRAPSSRTDPVPIFIVGMPRSGTTLIEQILASHPEIEGTAELPTMSAIARSIGERLGRSELDYTSFLAGYSGDALRLLGERYLSHSAMYRRTDRAIFTDKMPSNWMHVALIRLILPQARIIDVRRDPLDCCFSNFAQNFPRGHEFAHSLPALGEHYRTYERLMAHFDAADPGAVTQVRYEKLVETPEDTIRELLARLELPFAQSCLHFFENDRAVRTPSAQQVRQPINRRGIGRWRPYERWLGPLLETLAET